jgi:hypothetical protein
MIEAASPVRAGHMDKVLDRRIEIFGEQNVHDTRRLRRCDGALSILILAWEGHASSILR